MIKEVESRLRLMKSQSGEVVGRACIFERAHKRKEFSDYEEYIPSGIVTIGGFRSCELSGVCGVMVGKPHTAARNIGVPVADLDVLQPWASEQADLTFNVAQDREREAEYAAIIRTFHGATGNLCIAEGAGGWKNAEEISREDIDDEVLILQDAALSLKRRDIGEITLHKNVFAVDMGIPGILQTGHYDVWIDWPPEEFGKFFGDDMSFFSQTLHGALMESIAKAWNVPLLQLLKVSQSKKSKNSIEREIGLCNGKPVVLDVDVIKKPKSS